MKHLSTLLLLSLLAALAACNSGSRTDEADEAAAPSSADGETPATEPATPAGEPSETDQAQKPKVVEESAGVPEEQQSGNEPIKLARANVGEPERDWKFKEGEQFDRLVPTQPTVGGADKIEVAEVFWYGCPHCRNLEPYLNRWAEHIPADVRFVHIPAVWNPLVKLHAQLYYTEQVLVDNGAIKKPEEFRASVFREYHERGNRLASESAIQSFFERSGVTGQQFQSAWNSFEVAQKLRVAEDLARRYNISSVPTLVVNGKYRTGPAQAGGLQEVTEVVDELVARESIK